MPELIPIKASELPLDNSLSAGEVIFAKGDQLFRVDLVRILEENGGGTPSTGKDGIISGASEHIEDYTFRFIASLYRINGTIYDTVLNTLITFDAADPVLNRIDLVVIELVDSIPQIKVIKGVPGNPASKPLLTDPDKQIEFTFVTIFAGTSEPTNIENTLVYDENLQQAGGEFNTSITGTGIFLEDTSDPYKGTKAILFEDVSLDNSVKFTSSVPILTNNSNLLIKVKVLNSASVSGLGIDIGGNSISISNGNHGFSQYNTSAYQSLIIPLSLFQETSFTEINIRSRVAVGRNSTNLLLDDIVIQKGTFTPVIDDVQWNEITGDQSEIFLSGFTNDLDIPTLQEVTNSGAATTHPITAPKFIDSDGTERLTGTVIDMSNNIDGTIYNNVTPSAAASFSVENLKAGGESVNYIDTTGKTDFPTVTNASGLVIPTQSDAFREDAVFMMMLYSTNGIDVEVFYVDYLNLDPIGTTGPNEEYTVSTLPSTPARGDKAFITDATAPTYLGVVVGGGSVFCEVMYNGTDWVTI